MALISSIRLCYIVYGLLNRAIIFVVSIVILLTGLSSCSINKNISQGFLRDSSIVFEPINEYASMRIPALVVTNENSLLAFCEGRIGTSSDWAEMDLLMRKSTDGGKSWETPIIIAPRQGPHPTSNPTPIVGSDGTIHLLYQRDYAKAYYTKSVDDGRTWSEAVDITHVFEQFKPEYDWKVLAPGPGHSIQLKSGRLVAPVWLANSSKLIPHRTHNPSCVATIYSDDLGKTWQRGAIIADNSPELKNPNESMLVQLDDGRVMITIRNPSDEKRKSISYSMDGISNWSKPVFDDELFEPVCMSSIIKASLKKNNKRSALLFLNPDSEHLPKHPRQNLTVKVSTDNGNSWTKHKVINEGPSGYSDIAVGNDGTVYCLYETNTVSKGWNYSLVLKTFKLKDLIK